MQKPFTQSDRNKLKRKLGMMSIFIAVFITIFTFIYSFVLKDFSTTSDGFDYLPAIVFGLFGLFFIGVIGYMVWIFVYDLKNGVKNCFEGIVEDKRLNIEHNTSMRSGAGKTGRKTTTKRYFHIIVDGTKHKVERDLYMNVNVGDDIYFEIAPKSNVLLSYEVLKKTIPERQITRYKQGNYPDSKIRQTALTREDKNHLNVLYSIALKTRLRKLAFVGLPIFGLLIYGLGSLLVFLFPLPIIFIYHLYKLLKLYFNHRKSVAERKKNLVEAQVADKFFTTVSHNGSMRQNYTLKTTYKTIKVPEIVYENVTVGDEIILHETLHLPIIIGIAIADEYYEMV